MLLQEVNIQYKLNFRTKLVNKMPRANTAYLGHLGILKVLILL